MTVTLVGAACQDASTPSRKEPRGSAISERIALNRATLKQLEALPGIDVERAKSLMASRNARGGRFDKLEDIVMPSPSGRA